MLTIISRSSSVPFRGICFLDTDHVANLEEDTYQSNQEEAIHACRKHLKDFAFRQGVRNLS